MLPTVISCRRNSLRILVILCAGNGLPVFSEPPQTIATVGKSRIRAQDVAYREAVEKAYGNTTISREATLVSLVNDALSLEVLRRQALGVSDKEVALLRKHVDETSRAPEVLDRVKKVFGNDTGSYSRLYLAPKVVQQKLRDFQGRNTRLHRDERAAIEKAFRHVKSGKSFEQAALKSGLKFHVSRQGDSVTPTVFPGLHHASTLPMEGPLLKILASLQPGQIYADVIEDDNAYKLIRLLEKNASTYEFESISAVKKSFDEWYQLQTGKVKIEIADPALKEAVLEKYGGIWWAKSLIRG